MTGIPFQQAMIEADAILKASQAELGYEALKLGPRRFGGNFQFAVFEMRDGSRRVVHLHAAPSRAVEGASADIREFTRSAVNSLRNGHSRRWV